MTALLELGRAGRPITEYPVIDMHGHLGRYAFAIPDLSPESLVADMDRIGVREAVCSPMSCMAYDPEVGNAHVCEAMEAHPGRIRGYVGVYPLDAETVRKRVEKWLTAGFTGIKLHRSNGFPYTDPAYAPAYELAHERKLPALFHTWGEARDFAEIGELAEQYPDMQILLGHSGVTSEGGYMTFAEAHDNVFLELCSSVCARGLVRRLVDGVGAEKVVWGSDALFISMTQQIGKVMAAGLDAADAKAVLSDNALAILDRAEIAS